MGPLTCLRCGALGGPSGSAESGLGCLNEYLRIVVRIFFVFYIVCFYSFHVFIFLLFYLSINLAYRKAAALHVILVKH